MNKILTLLFGAALALAAPPIQAQTTGVLREVWNNLDGSTIADLTLSPDFPSAPNSDAPSPV